MSKRRYHPGVVRRKFPRVPRPYWYDERIFPGTECDTCGWRTYSEKDMAIANWIQRQKDNGVSTQYLNRLLRIGLRLGPGRLRFL